jgi:hypothetical protein
MAALGLTLIEVNNQPILNISAISCDGVALPDNLLAQPAWDAGI